MVPVQSLAARAMNFCTDIRGHAAARAIEFFPDIVGHATARVETWTSHVSAQDDMNLELVVEGEVCHCDDLGLAFLCDDQRACGLQNVVPIFEVEMLDHRKGLAVEMPEHCIANGLGMIPSLKQIFAGLGSNKVKCASVGHTSLLR